MKPTNFESYLIDLEEFEKKKELARGGFGTVLLIQRKTDGKLFAAKTVFRSGITLDLQREIGILIRVQGPTIVPFYGFSHKDWDDWDHPTLVMEYMEKESLERLINLESRNEAPPEYDNTAKQIILCGIAHGMMVLHSQRIIHRDLKPQNVLLDSQYRPYITDFGLSKFVAEGHSNTQSRDGIGTVSYMAPEIIRNRRYNYKVDVYAFGILMYELIFGQSAYDDLPKLQVQNYTFFEKIQKGQRPKFDNKPIKPTLRKLMESCWDDDPNKRPTFRTIFSLLSLSPEADDHAIISQLSEVLTSSEPKKINEDDEDVGDYSSLYCLPNVDKNKLFDYILAITTSPSEIKQEELRKIVNEQSKRIAQLEEQNKSTQEKIKSLQDTLDNAIKEMETKNQQEMTEKHRQHQTEIDNLKSELSLLKSSVQKASNPEDIKE